VNRSCVSVAAIGTSHSGQVAVIADILVRSTTILHTVLGIPGSFRNTLRRLRF
jgi:hypothetical protein